MHYFLLNTKLKLLYLSANEIHKVTNQYIQELVNAFVDVRSTLTRNSSLIVAITYGHQELIECMLDLIWNVIGASIDSSLIFINILKSRYNNDGDSILEKLMEFKLFSVLNHLLRQNLDCDMSFLLDKEITLINNVMGYK